MVFFGVLVNTDEMTVSVPPERLQELFSRCSSLLSVDHVSRTELQSLLGVMSYVAACVRPARVFMYTLLHTLCIHKTSAACPLSSDNKADLRWWCHFLPFYNGVSIIKTSLWKYDPLYLSTDACTTGAGGFFDGLFRAQFFIVLATTSIPWNCSQLWQLLRSGLLFYEVSDLSSHVTIKPASSQSTLDTHALRECNAAYVKFGFFLPLVTWKFLPPTYQAWQTPWPIISAAGICLACISNGFLSYRRG